MSGDPNRDQLNEAAMRKIIERNGERILKKMFASLTRGDIGALKKLVQNAMRDAIYDYPNYEWDEKVPRKYKRTKTLLNSVRAKRGVKFVRIYVNGAYIQNKNKRDYSKYTSGTFNGKNTHVYAGNHEGWFNGSDENFRLEGPIILIKAILSHFNNVTFHRGQWY